MRREEVGEREEQNSKARRLGIEEGVIERERSHPASMLAPARYPARRP